MMREFAEAIVLIVVLTAIFCAVIELQVGRPLVVGEVILLLVLAGMITFVGSLMVERE